MYAPRKDPEEGDAFGAFLKRSVADIPIEVWPENWPTFLLFSRLSTQWRIGMAGPTGLDYSALYPLLDKVATSSDEWDEIFEDVRVMERAALDAMRETS